MPAARRGRYEAVLGLSAYDAAVLVADPDALRLFEATLAADAGLDPKQVANWVTGDYLRLRNQATAPIDVVPAGARGADPSRRRRVDLAGERQGGPRGVPRAGGDGIQAIVEARGFRQISDTVALGVTVDEVLAANPAAVADYRAGKVEVVGFLVGQVMKTTRRPANAALAQAAVRERLTASGGE